MARGEVGPVAHRLFWTSTTLGQKETNMTEKIRPRARELRLTRLIARCREKTADQALALLPVFSLEVALASRFANDDEDD